MAYRMLGSLSEADDAVQDTWLRFCAADTGGVDNLGGWLTTVVARVCLNMLRGRARRREDPLDVRTPAAARQLASRARRRVQGQAPVPDPDLARQRAVVDAFFAAARDGDFDRLVAVLDPDVILRADGGPLRPGRTVVIRSAGDVAAQAVTGARFSPFVRPALINGAAGVVVVANGRALAVMGFTVTHGRIVAIDVLYDPDRLIDLDLTVLDDVS